VLTDLVARHFGYEREQLRTAIFSLYADTQISATAHVASCAPLATEAANAGDAAALRILKAAGQVLGDQLTFLIRKNNLPDDLPLTISGSAWKSHRILFDTFLSCIKGQCADRPVIIPDFEPILGVMIHHYRTKNGHFDAEAHAKFQELYPNFAFRLPFSVN